MEALLHSFPTTSNDLNVREARDMLAQRYLNKDYIKRESHLISGNLISVFKFSENILNNNIYYFLSL